MLLKLRGGLDSFFVTILLGLLIGAFAIFGIGPSMLNSGNQSVATVGDTNVSTQSYVRQVNSRAQQLQNQFGGQFTSAQIINLMQLDQQILNQMIAEAAITEHLGSLSMRAGDQEIRSALQEIDGFVLPDGTLSKDLIEQALQRTGLSRVEFMTDVRQGISRQQLFESLASENAMPPKFAEALYIWQAERRRATLIDIKAADMIDIPTPTDEDLQTYYDENIDAYKTAALRTYNYILVTPAQFVDGIEVEEKDVLEQFEANNSLYNKPEQRVLQQVSFNDKAGADAFLTAVNAGADFVEAGASVTDFTIEEIELGTFAKEAVVTEYSESTANLIFALEDGGSTEAVRGYSGWSVFRVAGITPAETKTLEDVRPEIEQALKEYQADGLMQDAIDKIYKAGIDDGSPTLAAVAEETGLTLATVSNVTSQGRSASSELKLTQQNEYVILNRAYGIDIGDELGVTDIDPRDRAKGLFLVEVTDIKDPEQRPLEDVKGDLTSAWTAVKRLEKAGEVAELARTRLAAGEKPEDVIAAIGGTSFVAKNVSRTAQAGSSLALNIRDLIFDLPTGSIDFERSADGNGYIVVRVDDVTAGDPLKGVVAIETLITRLNGELANEIYAQYQAYLLAEYPVSINRTLQQSLFSEQNQQQ
ncbi:MAG: hypothetical protein COB37_01250 [Kordiimonadales bacterium]|nr:MAG: hypothetical protein COB37_01250 [Kordiimonadales bacterium]